MSEDHSGLGPPGIEEEIASAVYDVTILALGPGFGDETAVSEVGAAIHAVVFDAIVEDDVNPSELILGLCATLVGCLDHYAPGARLEAYERLLRHRAEHPPIEP